MVNLNLGGNGGSGNGNSDNGQAYPPVHYLHELPQADEERLERIFKKLDRDGNGRIDIHDLSTALKEFGLSHQYAEISLCGHKLTAHRNQLKMMHAPFRQSKVFVTNAAWNLGNAAEARTVPSIEGVRNQGSMGSRKRCRSLTEEADFLGFPDVPLVPEDVPPEKKRHVQIRSPVVTRSKANSDNRET